MGLSSEYFKGGQRQFHFDPAGFVEWRRVRRNQVCGDRMKPKLYLVMTTCADREQAERLARRLVEQRLAACVSIGSAMVSVYPWEGRVNTEQEIPLSIKTSPKHIDKLKRAFEQIHDYDVPEMLVLPVTDGLQPYFDWADDWMNE